MERRLLFDIETSLGKAYIFRAGYGINVPAFHIFEEPKIICIAYKFLGQKKTYCLDWGKNRDDKAMLQKFLRIANSADVIIGHNSDRFDIKYLRTRCFYHKVPMMPEYTSIDTYKEAKKGFLYQSNGLDYINKYGGHKGKDKTEFALWVSTTEGDRKALKEMKTYCMADVNRLEETYNDMLPYIKHKTSIAEYKSDCPGCGSSDMRVKSYKITASGTKYVQLQCHGCGRYHKSNAKTFEGAKKKKKTDEKRNAA